MKMCIFEVVSHSVDIVNYIASMWHVFSNNGVQPFIAANKTKEN
jgi:hypothetical protein